MLDATWPPHPWAANRTVRFGVAGGPTASWSQLVDLVQDAESLGYDAYWATDHPVHTPGCWTTLAGLAGVTRTMRIGTLVSCVLYRSPAELARMAADVDRMSDGRLILGVGVGTDEDEFKRLGLPMPAVRDRMVALEETVLSVRQLWQHGLRPPPVQEPRIPLLIGGGGERRTLRQVAQYADAASFIPAPISGPVDSLTPDDIARKCAVLGQYCAELGRPFSSVLRTKTAVPVVIAEQRSRAMQKLEAIPPQIRARFAALTIAGTPEEAQRALRPFVEVGVSYFMIFVAGNDHETLRLLAQRVLPALALGRDG